MFYVFVDVCCPVVLLAFIMYVFVQEQKLLSGSALHVASYEKIY